MFILIKILFKNETINHRKREGERKRKKKRKEKILSLVSLVKKVSKIAGLTCSSSFKQERIFLISESLKRPRGKSEAAIRVLREIFFSESAETYFPQTCFNLSLLSEDAATHQQKSLKINGKLSLSMYNSTPR